MQLNPLLAIRRACRALTGNAPRGRPVAARSLRIAVVSDRAFPYFKGGSERRYWELAKRLTAAGHQVDFYTALWPGMSPVERIEGITLHGICPAGEFYVHGRKSILESVRFSFAVLVHLLRDDYDIIDCDQFPLIPIISCKIAVLIRGKSLVVTWHESWDANAWNSYIGLIGRVGLFIQNIALRLPDRLISVSEMTTTKLINEHHVDASRIITIHSGSNIYSHSATTVEKNTDIVYFGRLIAHKRVDLVLQTVARLKARGRNASCLIVGDGPERPALEALSATLHLSDRVVFAGHVALDSCLRCVIRSSRLLLFPSQREGFGLSVLEANACGVPAIVVRDKNSAASAQVTDGRNGFVCAANATELASAVESILGAPLDQFTAASIAAAMRYSWDRAADAIQAVYFSALRGPSVVQPVSVKSMRLTCATSMGLDYRFARSRSRHPGFSRDLRTLRLASRTGHQDAPRTLAMPRAS